MICGTCGTHVRPGSKFCSSCGTPVSLSCAHCGSPLEADDRFCAHCGTPVEGAASATAAEVTSPARAVDPGERRVISVLFLDLVGFTPLTETRDSEEVRGMLTRYFDRAQETVERFGGLIEKYIGDAVMAVWGARTTQEDDAERAVRAGLELLEGVRALGAELGIDGLDARAGILTGQAMVGGGGNQSTGMVVGDIVNSAARLQSIADPGTVLVGDRTRELTERSIQYQEAGVRAVKGKAEPISSWQALRVTSGRRGEGKSDALVPPFVGRSDELRLLKDQLHAVGRESRPRMVSLIGQGGIGKSRLIEELANYADGLADRIYWHQGRAPSYGDGLNFWAIGEMVRRRCGIAETDDDHKARTKLRTALAEYVDDEGDRSWLEPRLAGLLGLAETPQGDRSELFAAWRTFFEWVAKQGPTVMVFEDTQWADEGTLDFIEDLAAGSRSPILIVVLGRPSLFDKRPSWASGHGNSITLRLAPLSERAVAELVAGVAPGISGEMTAKVVERAAGIPLYAVEFLRSLVAGGALRRDGDGFVLVDPDVELTLPDSLRGVVGARLDQLPADDRELLQAAAILGYSFTLSAIATLAEGDLVPALDRFVRQDILEFDRDPRSPERGQYRFVQSVIREVAHERISRAERTARHLQVARYYSSLETPELAGAAATHYLDALEAAGGNDPEIRAEAVAAIEEAALRAAELQSHQAATATALQGVEIAEDGPAAARLMIVAATSAAASLHPEAEALGERAVAMAAATGDAVLHLRAATALGKLYCDYKRGRPAFDLLHPLLQGDDPMTEDRARALNELARASMLVNDPGMLDVLERCLTIAERLDLAGIVAGALNTRGTILFHRGRLKEGRALLQTALAAAEEEDHGYQLRRALNNLIYLSTSDVPRRGMELAERRVALARRYQNPRDLFDALDGLAGFRLVQGDFDGVTEILDEMKTMNPSPLGDISLRGTELSLAYQREPLPTAGAEYEALVEEYLELEPEPDKQILDQIENNRAEIEFVGGEYEAAFERTFAIQDHSPNMFDTVGPLLAALRLGDADRVAAVKDRFEDKVYRGRFVDSMGTMLRSSLMALAGDQQAAVSGFDGVFETWDAIYFPLYTAVFRAAVADVLGVDHPFGRTLGERAHEALSTMGAATYLALYGDVFSQLPITSSAAG